jgi:hypothetical protein
MGMRRLILAIVFLSLGTASCLASNPSAPGASGDLVDAAVDPRSDSVMADQTKPHPGSVAAPDPDVTETIKDTAKGTKEVLCRSEKPAGYRLRLKGQVFLYRESPLGNSESPCEACEGKALRVVFEAGGEDRYEDGTIGAAGVFDVTLTAPDPTNISLYVVGAWLPSQMPSQMPQPPGHSLALGSSDSPPSPEELPGNPCGASCIDDRWSKIRDILDPVGSAESAPECMSLMSFPKKGFPPLKLPLDSAQ